MRRLLPATVLLAFLFSAAPIAARADGPTPVLDQSFLSPTNITVSAITRPLVYVAQTFTAGQSGLLRAVTLDLHPSLDGDMRVDIRTVANGLPTDTVLGTRSLSRDELQALQADPLAYQVTLPDIYITAGTQYAIVVNYTSYMNDSNPQALWFGANGDAYAGGSAFTALDGPALNWAPAGSGYDLHFQTYVITGMPVADLSITRRSGPKKAHACQVFRETYRITNHGPDAAQHLQLSIGGGDQFEGVSVGGVPGSLSNFFDLAAGQSRTFVTYYKVVAFGFGETRDAFIGASIYWDIYPSISIDPNPANNTAGTPIWLVGPPRDGCPR